MDETTRVWKTRQTMRQTRMPANSRRDIIMIQSDLSQHNLNIHHGTVASGTLYEFNRERPRLLKLFLAQANAYQVLPKIPLPRPFGTLNRTQQRELSKDLTEIPFGHKQSMYSLEKDGLFYLQDEQSQLIFTPSDVRHVACVLAHECNRYGQRHALRFILEQYVR